MISAAEFLKWLNVFGIPINGGGGGGTVDRAQVQNQAFTFANAGGTANALTLALSPSLTSYQNGQYLSFKAAANNTAATTINVNGLGAKPIVTNGNNALTGGEILINGDYMLMYNSTFSAFVLINSSLSSGGGITATQIQNQAFTHATDTGTVNTYAITLSPAVTGYSDGQFFIFTASNANTGSSTLNVNGLGAVTIHLSDNSLLRNGDILSGTTYVVVYKSGTSTFIILNPSIIVFPENIQKQSYTYAVDTGAANAYVVTLSPVPTYTTGQIIYMNPIHNNTGASTVKVNGLGARSILSMQGAALTGGEIVSARIAILLNVGGAFILVNSAATIVSPLSIQKQSFTYSVDSGAANAYVATLSPALTSYTDGDYICLRAVNSNTGASTLSVNGLAAKPIVNMQASALIGGEIVAGIDYIFVCIGTNYFTLINASNFSTITDIQNQAHTYEVDTGVANAYVIALFPTITSYVDGQLFSFSAVNANTAASTLDAGGGAIAIVTNANAALVGGEILINGDYLVQYNLTFNAFVLINPSNGLKTPTMQQFTSSSGTYTTPNGCLYIDVEMTGGGGGGQGGGSGSPGTGTNGANTTFGTSLLTCNGGGADGGAVGSATGGDINITGQVGDECYSVNSGGNINGGTGGSTAIGSGGQGGGGNGVGENGSGFGAGGQGGGATIIGTSGGTGGSSAGYLRKRIINPSATYSYAVGANGTGGVAGTNGQAGGDGVPGIITVYEYYS